MIVCNVIYITSIAIIYLFICVFVVDLQEYEENISSKPWDDNDDKQSDCSGKVKNITH